MIPSKNADLYRRFRLYGFGVVLGILVVTFMYKGKGCQLPSSAKLEELNFQPLTFSTNAMCLMTCKSITESEIKQVMKSGKIDFGKSDVHNEPYKRYAVDGLTANKKKYELIIEDCDTISKLISIVDIKLPSDTCHCN